MEVDFSDPVVRRAYLEELRRERLVEEEAQAAPLAGDLLSSAASF